VVFFLVDVVVESDTKFKDTQKNEEEEEKKHSTTLNYKLPRKATEEEKKQP